MTQDKRQEGGSAFSLWQSARKNLIAGLAVTFPLFVTIYIIVAAVRLGDRFVGTHINEYLVSNYDIYLPGLGLLLLLIGLAVVGFFSSNFIGRWIPPFIERVLMRIPVMANLYPSAKQLSDFLFSREKRGKFQKVVLVPYPHLDSYSIGFITNEGLSVSEKGNQEELVSVLVPLAPAPFSGILLFIDREKIKVLDISVEEAVKMIVSGGVVPPKRKNFRLTDFSSGC